MNYPRQEVQFIIPLHHQAIITSYRFNCSGYVVEWGVDVFLRDTYALHFQVWRLILTTNETESPMESSRYILIGQNSFADLSPVYGVLRATPLPEQQVLVKPGDVVGIYANGTQQKEERGVVGLTHDQGFGTEELWMGAIYGGEPTSGGRLHR